MPRKSGCAGLFACDEEVCRKLSGPRLASSLVAGFVSFLVATIMGISFGMLVFRNVPGGVAVGVHMALVGVNLIGNSLLFLVGQLPCVVVTADNGVVAPLAAELVGSLAKELTDPQELLATAVAGVACSCVLFGLVQLLLVKLNLVRLVQFLPYSIPMGFLSGIGLELCAGVQLAGSLPAQAAAAAFAACLCLGSWWRGWPLSTLLPSLLATSVGAFYLLGGGETWLLHIGEEEGASDGSGASPSLVSLWTPGILDAVRWGVLLRHGKLTIGTLCLLGCLQNCLFAGLFSRVPGLKVTANEVLCEFSQAFTVGGCLGLAGGFHNMACFSLSRELHSYRRVPGGVVAALSCLLWLTGLGPVLKLPRFVFAGLLLWVGCKFLRTYLFQPAQMLPRSETAVIVCVASIMKLGGFTTGVLVGLLLALVSMVGELASLSCVQLVSYGDDTRSNSVRSVRGEQLLLSHGRQVLVLRLASGFVFFATSSELLHIVEEELHVSAAPWQVQDPLVCNDSDSEDEGGLRRAWNSQTSIGSADLTPMRRKLQKDRSLVAVVIDFTLCRGFDGSLVGVLQQLATLGSQCGFQLHLAGLQIGQQAWLRSHTAQGVCSFHSDLDRALETVENRLLDRLGMTLRKETRARSMSTSGVPQPLSSVEKAHAALACAGWALLLVYANNSATSRSARPIVAQAMSLLQGRCEFFEASASACPELAERYGPCPALVLLLKGQLMWRLQCAMPSPKPQTRRSPKGAAMPKSPQLAPSDLGGSLPAAPVIAREVEQRIRTHAAEALDVPREVQETKSAAQRGLVPRAEDSSQAAWPEFLELAGASRDGPLVKLAPYLTGPKLLEKGSTLMHKGEAAGTVVFVARGLLSLWNEGLGHDQDQPLVHRDSFTRRTSQSQPSEDERDMLSKGTSRLLRIGPGWVLGSAMGFGVISSQDMAPLTCTAETQVEVFELAKADCQRLQAEDPVLMLALHELTTHFSAVLVRHMAKQLSDWHSLLYS